MIFKNLKYSKLIANKVSFSLILCFLAFFLQSCSVPKALKPSKIEKNIPVNAKERARQNIEQGKGLSLKGMMGNKSTNYEFSTSNPLWRASLETIDFMPLSTVDYSGGIIITDWYSDASSTNDSIKITVRFLSNEVRSDSLKVIAHKRTCKTASSCNTVILENSAISQELVSSIIKKAALLKKADKEKK